MNSIADTSMVNAYIPGKTQLSGEDSELIARRDRLLGPAYRLMYETPIHVVRGEGVWLYDNTGRAYLDVYNNVTSIGHCHPHVVEAVSRQLATLSTNTRYLHETILNYAEKLLATFPQELGHVMFTCTGSEANDLALRIAKTYTGGTGIIVTETAYHGITDCVSQFSPSLGPSVNLGQHVRTVPAPNLYRSDGADVGETFAVNVRSAIKDMLRHGIQPAVLIVDTLFTSDGVLSDPPGFLAGAVEAIREAGGIFIADEVQPGFARTGSHMWGFQRHGLTPDIVTLGKPMGNGHPIAGVVVKPEVVEEFGRRARYFNTFGGNTVSCTAGLAVLEVIEKEGLKDNAREVGSYLHSSLEGLSKRHPSIGNVRGAGLFLGVEMVRNSGTREPDREITARVVNGMREKGVLISACGIDHNVLKVRPPLIFSRANADTFLNAMDKVLSEV
jgi:4-aminobutyrate aminotransferase-like enzyme